MYEFFIFSFVIKVYIYVNFSYLKITYFIFKLFCFQTVFIIVKFNPKLAWVAERGEVNLTLPCDFTENIPSNNSKERTKLCFFVPFNIIISCIFPEDFIEIPQVI